MRLDTMPFRESSIALKLDINSRDKAQELYSR